MEYLRIRQIKLLCEKGIKEYCVIASIIVIMIDKFGVLLTYSDIFKRFSLFMHLL